MTLARRASIGIGSIVIAFALVLGGGAALVRYLHGPKESESAFRGRIEANGVLPVTERAARRAFSGQKLSFKPARDFTPAEVGLLSRARMSSYQELTLGPELVGVEFLWGGADAHYGIIIMRPGRTPMDGRSHLRHWNDDTWYYSEIPIW